MKESRAFKWSPNWSGRGLAMQNVMETTSIKSITTNRKEVTKEDRHKLRELLRYNPKNNFYKSLANQLVIYGGLTEKQVLSIQQDHTLI